MAEPTAVRAVAEPTVVRAALPTMGTVLSVAVVDPPADPGPAIASVGRWLARVEALFTTFRPDSEISRLGRGEIALDKCSAEVREVLALCETEERLSDGAFSAWRDGRLDPAGMVKGWAVAGASRQLSAAGFTNHCVNGGGDAQCVGPSRGDGWIMGIAHPFAPGALLGSVRVHGAIATSGSYERGAHVRHALTGKTGPLVALTVLAPDVVWADAHATAGFALADAVSWLTGLTGFEALGVRRDGSWWMTPGFGGLLVSR